jgi:hypothetical protein
LCLQFVIMGKKERKPCTRYGPIADNVIKFGSEQRFQWQNAKNSCDCAYEIPDDPPRKSVIFPADPKKPLCDNPDAAKNSTGPGSYDVSKGFDVASEYVKHVGNKFSVAQRQSMAMKTPSPGAVYNIDKVYYNGPDHGQKVGFNLDSRKPLYDGDCAGKNADPVYPKLPTTTGITIGRRFKPKARLKESPSYDPYVSVHFLSPAQFYLSLSIFDCSL